MKPHNKKNANGFSLIEVVVAMALTVTIIVMTARIFNQSTQAIDRGKANILLDNTARNLLDALEEDISQALIRSNVQFDASLEDELYMVSTAVKNGLFSYARDFSLVKIETEKNESSLKLSLRHSGNSSEKYINKHSIFYTDQSIIEGDNRYGATSAYNDSLSTNDISNSSSTVLTGIHFQPSPQRSATDKPLYLDIQITLIDSKILQQALFMRESNNIIKTNEKQYYRRIPLRNTGPTKLLNP